ncbi:MAG: NADH-quinone oxidoreductase subunit M [Aigarchaeota archaeon]|nr:NADH-quinone oxidoreductase subunit M [Aigarchaeota archaeon]MDH5702913.1 NADH-quinone oxidoreductase subunit M [Aigarchaeota archaeon]
MPAALLWTIVLPAFATPLIYFLGRRSQKLAAIALIASSVLAMGVLATTAPVVMSEGRYVEPYSWIPMLGSTFSLFVDGVSLSLAMVTLVLVICAAIFSIDYMQDKKGLPQYYALLSLLTVGLVGVFITSCLLTFYLFWELMLVPTYFIVGAWGYRNPFRAALKFFIFTHTGAVFVLLGIGAIYASTGTLDMFEARRLLATASPGLLNWILAAVTLGFAVKMAIVPVHVWLPDTHSEAPAPMSALLSGVIIEAGAYAILRVSLGTIFPALTDVVVTHEFLKILAIFGVVSAFYGAFAALGGTDIKRVVAYSSVSHMGYVLYGLSLFSFPEGFIGAVLHLVNHAASKGLLFLNAGSVMKETGERNIDKMGGLAAKMPLTAVSSTISALSIAGTPGFACFVSEFLMFSAGFKASQVDSFYVAPTVLMLIATVLSLGYALRFLWKVFLGHSHTQRARGAHRFMMASMVILTILVVLLGLWPAPFIELISSVGFP